LKIKIDQIQKNLEKLVAGSDSTKKAHEKEMADYVKE